MPRRPLASFGALLSLAVLLGGCDGDQGATPNASEGGANPPAPPKQARLIESVPTRCDVGARPEYFVPGPADSPLALLGCARLGVGGRRVEFSGNLARIHGESHLCLNAAYSARGRRGFYIPAICKLDPPPSGFAIRGAGQPRQGVRGYALVIWGTAEASTSHVVARFNAGRARAAVFEVHAKLARKFGEAPFALFAFELPLAAACGSVTVHREGSDAWLRIPPRRKLCERA
jgi:hypothetical protein